MAQDILCCNFLRGKIFVAKRKPNAAYHDVKALPLKWVGNVSALNISQETETISIPDYSKFSGDACKLIRPTTKTLTLTMACFKAANLAMAFQGEGSFENVPAAGTVVDEIHTVTGDDDRIEFDYIPNGQDITVTDGATPTPVPYVLNDDYRITPFGIEIVEGGGISDGDVIHVGYDYDIQTIIEAFTKGSEDYYVVVEAINYGDGNRPVKIEMYNINFGPAASMDLFGDEFATFEITGEVKVDETVPATDSVTGLKRSQEFRYLIGSVPA